ncbi:MAG: eukaryotic-like serine/threonine-protein kinase, partial [Solirubrobacteraceae bacterium]|nr:eukaryotic-like serine/threonine-protein kinase [Solirubrobacteraceae bacterium]
MTARAGLLAVLAVLAAPAAAGASPIAFTRERGPGTEIWTVGENGQGVTRLVGDGAGQPAWSPDGTRLAFVRRGALHVTGAGGDATLAGAAVPQRPAWSPDGSRIAFTRRVAPAGSATVWIVPANGGAAAQLVVPPAGASDSSPDWSPDATAIAFTRRSAAGDSVVAVPAAGGPVIALADGRDPAWSPDGRMIAFTSTRDRNGASSDGTVTSYRAELYAMAADGSGQQRLTTSTAGEANPSWSPDGAGIAYTASPPDAATVPRGPPELYALSLHDGCVRRLTNLPGAVTAPSWQPRRPGEAAASLPCDFEPVAVPDTDLGPARTATHTVYWAGPTLDQNFLSGVRADPVTADDDDVVLSYDECLVAAFPYCTGNSVQVISASTCRWSPVRFSRYLGPPRSWRVIRGAIVADYRFFYYVIAGAVTVSFEKFGPRPDMMLARLR